MASVGAALAELAGARERRERLASQLEEAESDADRLAREYERRRNDATRYRDSLVRVDADIARLERAMDSLGQQLDVLGALRSLEAATSRQLQDATGLSQPTVSKKLRAMVATGEVVATDERVHGAVVWMAADGAAPVEARPAAPLEPEPSAEPPAADDPADDLDDADDDLDDDDEGLDGEPPDADLDAAEPPSEGPRGGWRSKPISGRTRRQIEHEEKHPPPKRRTSSPEDDRRAQLRGEILRVCATPRRPAEAADNLVRNKAETAALMAELAHEGKLTKLEDGRYRTA